MATNSRVESVGNLSHNRGTLRKGMARLPSHAKLVRISLVLILGGLGAIPLVILTPPFQVPDEVHHFYRAYQLSEIGFRADLQNGVAGGVLPVSIQRLVSSSVHTTDGLAYPATPAPLAVTLKSAKIPLDSSTRRFVGFPGSAFYSPLPYLPQALGIGLGRMLGFGPLQLLYIGRLFNCLTAVFLLGFAIKSAPEAEELILLVGFLPTSLFLCASVSPDAAVISCALLFCALSFAASKRGFWRSQELVIATVAAAVFCSVKPVYVPILLAGVVPGVFQRDKSAKVIRSHALILVVALGIAVSWLLFAKSSMSTLPSGAHPSVQLSLVLHHPGVFAHALLNTLGIRSMTSFYAQTVGIFGWNTIFLRPVIVYFLPIINLLIIWTFGNSGPRSLWQGIWFTVLVSFSVILIAAAMYLMYAQVGQDDITGVQGRYFIPILVLGGMALFKLFPSRRRANHEWAGLVSTTVIILIEVAATDSTIIHAFRVF